MSLSGYSVPGDRMVFLFTYIWLICMVSVGKYNTIHGSYGYRWTHIACCSRGMGWPSSTSSQCDSPSLGALKFLYFHGDDSIWRDVFCFFKSVGSTTNYCWWLKSHSQPPQSLMLETALELEGRFNMFYHVTLKIHKLSVRTGNSNCMMLYYISCFQYIFNM